MSCLGRNYLLGYCLPASGKAELRIDHIFPATSTLITSSEVDGQPDSNMGIVDSLGNCITVNGHGLGEFAIAVDGALVRQESVYKDILAKNTVLLSRSTEEIIAYMLADKARTCAQWPSVIKEVLSNCPGGYSLVVLSKEKIYAARDIYGVKPLVLGCIESENDVVEFEIVDEKLVPKNMLPNVVASTSVILDSIGAKYVRQILPGEIVEISQNGLQSQGICFRPMGDASTLCSMEYVTIAHPASVMDEQKVQNVQFRLGQALAKDTLAESDIVTTLPNISLAFMLGYAKESEVCIGEVFYYSNSVVDGKQLSIYKENAEGKAVTLIVDSLLNPDLCAAIYLLLKADAAKVHIRICSPKIVQKCPFGIDLSVNVSLLSEVTSVEYLRKESLASAISVRIPNREVKNIGHCFHCFGDGHSLLKF